MSINKKQANLMLLAVAILWGSSYVFAKLTVQAGMHSGLINACRGTMCVIAGYLLFFKKINKINRKDIKLGLLMGTINFLGYYLQTDALRYTTPAKNAFLTTLYIAVAPLILWLVWHERPQRKTYFAITLAIIGMAIITNVTSEGLHFQYGDLLTLVSTIFWALQLIYFGKYAPQVSSPWVVIFMIGLCQGVYGWITVLLTERSTLGQVHWLQALVPLAILAIGVTFLAQGMQITAQAYTDATSAGLILMLESFFASVFSVILGYDPLTPRLVVGGIILLLANAVMQVDLRQLPFFKKRSA
jgi:drug/metabolite transporter (DMT)-like permease